MVNKLVNSIIDATYQNATHMLGIQRFTFILIMIIIGLVCAIGIKYTLEHKNNNSVSKMIIHNHGKKWW